MVVDDAIDQPAKSWVDRSSDCQVKGFTINERDYGRVVLLAFKMSDGERVKMPPLTQYQARQLRDLLGTTLK